MATTSSRWLGCYRSGWRRGRDLVPEAFAHPAKYAKGLIERIISHGLQQSYWQLGDLVVDPFGGIGAGGVVATYRGLRWLGVELEPRFIDLGRQNFVLHAAAWEQLGYQQPTLLHGDSRQLLEVLRRSGQLAGTGQPDGIISSPPFEDQEPSHAQNDTPSRRRLLEGSTHVTPAKPGALDSTYGTSPGNLGNDAGETFWGAAQLIVQQCYQLLKSGGVAAWVAKDFIKKKKRVAFSDNWRRLCEACGFEMLEWVEASLVERRRQGEVRLDGDSAETLTERKSFFRRLAERKGSPRIDEEDVLFMRKPLAAATGGVAAVVSSPPYAESITGDHGETETAAETVAKRRTQGGSLGQSQRHGGYGVSDGQLGAMKE